MTVKFTQPQIEALIACVDIVDDGEWPFEDISREVARRGRAKLRSLGPDETVRTGKELWEDEPVSYKVEFLTTALSVDGSAQWRCNSFRYEDPVDAIQHFSYLRGPGAPMIEIRITPTADKVNCVRRHDGIWAPVKATPAEEP